MCEFCSFLVFSCIPCTDLDSRCQLLGRSRASLPITNALVTIIRAMIWVKPSSAQHQLSALRTAPPNSPSPRSPPPVSSPPSP